MTSVEDLARTIRDAAKSALPKDAPKPGKFKLADAAAPAEAAPAAPAAANKEGE